MNNVSDAAGSIEARLDRPARILCVDDEANVLASLRRLFRACGYEVLTAESGKAGLKILEAESVDLVISDMRMPEMDGARFLEHVCVRWPDTMRLLLTGHADIQSILHAINRGEIYRYITKPWDDNEIALVVRHALERKTLELEKRRLEALTQRQNEELKSLNANLEQKVADRTDELKVANASLVAANEKLSSTNSALLRANEKLNTNFLTSIKVFSNLIEMRGGNLAGHSRRVADLARSIALQMKLSERDTQEIFIAGLLHNIGKIGFPDALLATPVDLMDDRKLSLYRKFPGLGQQSLMPLEDLRGAAKIVRSQRERYDGAGFPDGLSGVQIPLGARILALAGDYDNLLAGTIMARRRNPDEARATILNGSGRIYDPRVVDAFAYVLGGAVDDILPDRLVPSSDLRPGMVLSRDLINRDGLLLLPGDHVLNQRLIEQIMEFDTSEAEPLPIHVHREGLEA